MLKDKRISVVIPSYKVAKHIKGVVDSLPEFIDHIVVIDDKCPQESGCIVDKSDDARIEVIMHTENQGVGGAVVSGYKKSLELECDIVVKIDGDGQMDPNYIEKLVTPIVDSKADYTKGNRFQDFKALKSMPKTRLFGNSTLSFVVKFSSGYWNVMDPTNGFTAISKTALEKLELNKLSKRYFFESDILINLNIQNIVVKDVAIPAKYGNEISSLSIGKVLIDFPVRLFNGLCKRIFYKYFIYDFNMASIYLVLGLPMVIFGSFFGAYRWYIGLFDNIENPTGTVMLSVLPLILGTQFLLQAINIDIGNIPKKEK